MTITATVDGVSGTAGVHLLDQVAYYAVGEFDYEIWVMDADGSNPTFVTDEPALTTGPAWWPRP